MAAKKPRDIDAFLATLDPVKRAALQKLRAAIHAAVPKAEECISYGVPSFKLNGRYLLSFGAGKSHCAFYPGALPIEVHGGELEGYGLSKGAIRFSAEKPIPATLVRKLVKTRVAQQAAK